MFYYCMMSEDDKKMQSVIVNALNKRYTDVYSHVMMISGDSVAMKEFLIDCTNYLASVYGVNVDVELSRFEDGEYPFSLGFSMGGTIWYNECAIENMANNPEQYEDIRELLLMLPIHELRHEVQYDAIFGKNVWRINDYRIKAWKSSYELQKHACDRIPYCGYSVSDINNDFYTSLSHEQDAIKFTWGCIFEIERRYVELWAS